jgi:hypothetical protein
VTTDAASTTTATTTTSPAAVAAKHAKASVTAAVLAEKRALEKVGTGNKVCHGINHNG